MIPPKISFPGTTSVVGKNSPREQSSSGATSAGNSGNGVEEIICDPPRPGEFWVNVGEL